MYTDIIWQNEFRRGNILVVLKNRTENGQIMFELVSVIKRLEQRQLTRTAGGKKVMFYIGEQPVYPPI